jgi:hypothetical protein
VAPAFVDFWHNHVATASCAAQARTTLLGNEAAGIRSLREGQDLLRSGTRKIEPLRDSATALAVHCVRTRD